MLKFTSLVPSTRPTTGRLAGPVGAALTGAASGVAGPGDDDQLSSSPQPLTVVPTSSGEQADGDRGAHGMSFGLGIGGW